jgi:hypothetical protein
MVKTPNGQISYGSGISERSTLLTLLAEAMVVGSQLVTSWCLVLAHSLPRLNAYQANSHSSIFYSLSIPYQNSPSDFDII